MNAFYQVVFLGAPKSLVQLIVMATFLLQISSITASAQTCGYVAGDGCANTDYNNSFINSTNNAATIEYDNWVSTFHSTAVRRSDGQFMVWGERMATDGVSHVLTPQLLNSINYPPLGNARVLKVTGFSTGAVDRLQFIALATDGLYAWGMEGWVIDNTLTGSTAFQKLTIGGNSTGLPPGVAPNQVKMISASLRSLNIVTCSGEVWMLSDLADMRGNGGSGNETTWYQVRASTVGNPVLSNIIAVRIQNNAAFALSADNRIFTWGYSYLGNGTAVAQRPYATEMNKPAGNIKMIGITYRYSFGPSYYVLINNGNLHSLGDNSLGQLGDWTTTERLTWVQPRYTSASGPVMNNIRWISPNENDFSLASINVLTTSRTLYSFGSNSLGMLGAPGATTSSAATNPVIPNPLSGVTDIVAVETGGHTSIISRCATTNVGYVGHWVNGSMGNGSAAELTQPSYTFTNTPVISICGANMFALLSPDPSVIPAFNAVNIYSTIQRVRIFRNPTSGGTLSYISGPGVLGAGDTLRFTGPGTVVLQYSVVNPVCGGLTTTQISLQALTGVLPLRLNAFTASMYNCQTLLSWQTDLEQNAERFEIEQSTTGTNWQQAGTVAALNNTQGGAYSYNIQQHHEPVMLYRLKMVDKDGSFSYSKIETVTNSCAGSETAIRVLPNPVSGSTATVMIYGGYRGRAMLVLYNNLGQKLVTKTINLTGNGNTEQIKMPAGAKGQYLLQLTDMKGVPLCTAQKLLKQ